MTVNVTIDSKLNNQAFKALQKEQKKSADTATKLKQLQIKLEKAVSAELKEQIAVQKKQRQLQSAHEKAVSSESKQRIADLRQQRQLQSSHEKAVASELKQRISDQRKLNSLSKKLDTGISQESKVTAQKQVQLRRLQSRHEKAVTSELKQQIAAQRKLNVLTRRLNKDLEKQRKERTLLGRLGKASASTGVGAGFIGAGGALAGAAIVSTLIDQGKVAIETAAKTERLRIANQNLAAGIDSNSDSMVKALRKVSNQTLSTNDALLVSNRALTFGIVKTEEDMTALAEAAIVLGRAQGLDALQSVEDLTVAISRQSPKILDNLGIILKQSEANQIYAEQNNLVAESLTEAEKAEAFRTVALQKALEKARELGGIQEDAAASFEAFNSSIENLQGALGKLAISGGDDSLVGGLTNATNTMADFIDEEERLRDKGAIFTELFGDQSQGFFGDLAKMMAFTEGMQSTLETSEFRSASLEQQAAVEAEYQRRIEESADALIGNANAFDENTESIEANEEALKRLEEVNKTRFDTASELLSIEDGLAEDVNEIWEDHAADQLENRNEIDQTILELHEDYAKDLLKIDKDLTKDLEKLNKSSAKSLEKINAKEQKDLLKLKEKQATEDKQQSKLAKIDALGDERLFNLSLKNLAAEGNAIAIQQALERREIEEQIAKEKAVVETQIEEQKEKEKIDNIKESAQERRDELAQDRVERAAQLREDSEEEKALLKERLEEEKAEEKQAFIDRSIEIKKFADEKQATAIEAKEKAIEVLAAELVEAQDLTTTELRALIGVAKKIGFDTGEAFADGIKQGSKKVSDIKNLLGQANSGPAITSSISIAEAGAGFSGFQNGGSFEVGGFGGPDSQLIAFKASPGERVDITPQGQSAPSIVINASGVGIDQLTARLEVKVNEALQEYTDDILAPALS